MKKLRIPLTLAVCAAALAGCTETEADAYRITAMKSYDASGAEKTSFEAGESVRIGMTIDFPDALCGTVNAAWLNESEFVGLTKADEETSSEAAEASGSEEASETPAASEESSESSEGSGTAACMDGAYWFDYTIPADCTAGFFKFAVTKIGWLDSKGTAAVQEVERKTISVDVANEAEITSEAGKGTMSIALGKKTVTADEAGSGQGALTCTFAFTGLPEGATVTKIYFKTYCEDYGESCSLSCTKTANVSAEDGTASYAAKLYGYCGESVSGVTPDFLPIPSSIGGNTVVKAIGFRYNLGAGAYSVAQEKTASFAIADPCIEITSSPAVYAASGSTVYQNASGTRLAACDDAQLRLVFTAAWSSTLSHDAGKIKLRLNYSDGTSGKTYYPSLVSGKTVCLSVPASEISGKTVSSVSMSAEPLYISNGYLTYGSDDAGLTAWPQNASTVTVPSLTPVSGFVTDLAGLKEACADEGGTYVLASDIESSGQIAEDLKCTLLGNGHSVSASLSSEPLFGKISGSISGFSVTGMFVSTKACAAFCGENAGTIDDASFSLSAGWKAGAAVCGLIGTNSGVASDIEDKSSYSVAGNSGAARKAPAVISENTGTAVRIAERGGFSISASDGIQACVIGVNSGRAKGIVVSSASLMSGWTKDEGDAFSAVGETSDGAVSAGIVFDYTSAVRCLSSTETVILADEDAALAFEAEHPHVVVTKTTAGTYWYYAGLLCFSDVAGTDAEVTVRTEATLTSSGSDSLFLTLFTDASGSTDWKTGSRIPSLNVSAEWTGKLKEYTF